MIETEQLVQLAAFARYGTLSKAAEALHISRSYVSRIEKGALEKLREALE